MQGAIGWEKVARGEHEQVNRSRFIKINQVEEFSFNPGGIQEVTTRMINGRLLDLHFSKISLATL